MTKTIELARKLTELGDQERACKAYCLALSVEEGLEPQEELEAATYVFFAKGDYKISFTTFVSLYNRGLFQTELMDLMMQAFYLPNIQQQQKRYDRNCRALGRYPYLFQKEFPAFDTLPICFFPFDDKGYIPFYRLENRFGNYVDFHDPVIDRYFFHDLENPILAKDVYSQYQLEYLNDNVRKSEWVGRENHIYLHYTDWMLFCSYLQCLNFTGLVKEQKFVFLIEDEISQYPIDFQARFGIDYSQYPVKPIGIREVNRMIWHTQLSAHNGGDFFNEILYDHPNLLAFESIMFDTLQEQITTVCKKIRQKAVDKKNISRVMMELAMLQNPTDKDIIVANFLDNQEVSGSDRSNARIVPALLFQPHFSNVICNIYVDNSKNEATITSSAYEQVRSSPLFHQFKYVKTFTPMRRPTSSYGATVRFMYNKTMEGKENTAVSDVFVERLVNRTFMIDRWDRLYRDSVLVRFEDGKLNPKATFTALAAFLDIPYTKSMTYCSGKTGLNPESLPGNDLGFDTAAIYRTYDEYVNDDDRFLLEYFMQDVYKAYGYNFHYYHGENVDKVLLLKKLKGFHNLDRLIHETFSKALHWKAEVPDFSKLDSEKFYKTIADSRLAGHAENRIHITENLMRRLQFVNPDGQPLHLMKKLELDPELLEQPLYH